MRHYTCDVCGDEMPSAYERLSKKMDGLAGTCKLEDVCPKCVRIGHNIPVREIILKHWREQVAAAGKEPIKPDVLRAKACEGDTIRGGAEKAAIHKRLMDFRGDPPRLGCLNELAAATKGKVTAEELRRIVVDGASPSIDVWRIIGKALDKLEAANE